MVGFLLQTCELPEDSSRWLNRQATVGRRSARQPAVSAKWGEPQAYEVIGRQVLVSLSPTSVPVPVRKPFADGDGDQPLRPVFAPKITTPDARTKRVGASFVKRLLICLMGHPPSLLGKSKMHLTQASLQPTPAVKGWQVGGCGLADSTAPNRSLNYLKLTSIV